MKKGWLIYDQEGAKRNKWFINECISSATRHGMELSLKIYEGEPLKKPYPEFALVRTIAPALNLDLEGAGTRVFNSYAVSRMANDKYLSHQAALELGLPVLPTDRSAARECSFAYDYPIVVKSRAGHGGQEVYLLHSEPEYLDFFRTHDAEKYITQQFCSEAGKDLRIYVLGGRILAGILRTSSTDFRSNYSLGGKVERIPVPIEIQEMVKKLHDRYAFDFVGIDFIRHEGKWVLNEIEDVVGSRMLYETTDLDVVELYISHIQRRLDGSKAE